MWFIQTFIKIKILKKKSLKERFRVLWISSEKQFQMRGGGGARGVNGSRCVCWGRGRGGEGGHLLSACVGECCECGGGLLFPSAGKQCPRRVFYGSCWTLISFVARLSSAAAALSPQKRARPPPSPPPRKATHHALLEVHDRPESIPHGKACNKSINNRSAQKWTESYELGCIKDITNE